MNDCRKKLRDFPHKNHYFHKRRFFNWYFPLLYNRIKLKLRARIRRTRRSDRMRQDHTKIQSIAFG